MASAIIVLIARLAFAVNARDAVGPRAHCALHLAKCYREMQTNALTSDVALPLGFVEIFFGRFDFGFEFADTAEVIFTQARAGAAERLLLVEFWRSTFFQSLLRILDGFARSGNFVVRVVVLLAFRIHAIANLVAFFRLFQRALLGLGFLRLGGWFWHIHDLVVGYAFRLGIGVDDPPIGGCVLVDLISICRGADDQRSGKPKGGSRGEAVHLHHSDSTHSSPSIDHALVRFVLYRLIAPEKNQQISWF